MGVLHNVKRHRKKPGMLKTARRHEAEQGIALQGG
jgi:hypothetical protein